MTDHQFKYISRTQSRETVSVFIVHAWNSYSAVHSATQNEWSPAKFERYVNLFWLRCRMLSVLIRAQMHVRLLLHKSKGEIFCRVTCHSPQSASLFTNVCDITASILIATIKKKIKHRVTIMLEGKDVDKHPGFLSEEWNKEWTSQSSCCSAH